MSGNVLSPDSTENAPKDCRAWCMHAFAPLSQTERKGKHAGVNQTHHKEEHKDDSEEGTASCTLEEEFPAQLKDIC